MVGNQKLPTYSFSSSIIYNFNMFLRLGLFIRAKQYSIFKSKSLPELLSCMSKWKCSFRKIYLHSFLKIIQREYYIFGSGIRWITDEKKFRVRSKIIFSVVFYSKPNRYNVSFFAIFFCIKTLLLIDVNSYICIISGPN